MDGRAEELLLAAIELTLESDDIQAVVLGREQVLDLLRDVGMGQEPPVGCLGLVVASSELASVSDLLCELHNRLEEVGVQA